MGLAGRVVNVTLTYNVRRSPLRLFSTRKRGETSYVVLPGPVFLFVCDPSMNELRAT